MTRTSCLKIYFLLILCGFLTAANAQPSSIKIKQTLENAYAKGEFSGVVLASKGDKILYQGAVGEANREWKVPNSLSTKFKICSVTKQFTAMLVMQLVEAGKINLDAPLSDYLPEFRKETASKITIRSLLLSASGLPQLPDDFYIDEDPKMTDANFVINKYLQTDLLFKPGEKFSYNNADFIVLGAVVEKVSGKSYEQNLREKILEPLAMKNTGIVRDEEIVGGMASGYSFKNNKFVNESFVQIQNFGAAGAIVSTAGDLLLWDKALNFYKLLSKKFTDEMFAPSKQLGFVALGSWSYQLNLGGVSKTIVERQGHINGFCALNLIIPEDQISVIFLSNTETETLFRTYAEQGLSYEILKSMTDK